MNGTELTPMDPNLLKNEWRIGQKSAEARAAEKRIYNTEQYQNLRDTLTKRSQQTDVGTYAKALDIVSGHSNFCGIDAHRTSYTKLMLATEGFQGDNTLFTDVADRIMFIQARTYFEQPEAKQTLGKDESAQRVNRLSEEINTITLRIDKTLRNMGAYKK